MNSSVNPFPEPPQSSDAQQPETTASQKHPIPHPSEPMQYRAIGLIQGQYQPSEGELNQGLLTRATGVKIDAVLLGRVLSVVKNHLDLEQSHLWVVYPRTKQEQDDLHVQIVGVWEPETLDSTTDTELVASPQTPLPEVKDGYFSIRGEVVYYSEAEEKVVVKILQSPKKQFDKPKFFKLLLKGRLSEKPVHHFWDLHVQLEGQTLVIQSAEDIGALPRPKPRFPRKGQKPFGKDQFRRGDSKPRPSERPTGDRPKPAKPIPRPKKKGENPS